MNDKTQWTHSYQAIADALRPHAADRAALVARLEGGCEEYRRLVRAHVLSGDDIDPFTIFALFDQIGQGDGERATIARSVAGALDLDVEVPETFQGMPVLAEPEMSFMEPAAAGETDHDAVDRLWALFTRALDEADEPSDSHRQALVAAWDALDEQERAQGKRTCAVMWVRPERYLCLGNRVRLLLSDPAIISPAVADAIHDLGDTEPAGREYLAVDDLVLSELPGASGLDSIPAIGVAAWNARID